MRFHEKITPRGIESNSLIYALSPSLVSVPGVINVSKGICVSRAQGMLIPYHWPPAPMPKKPGASTIDAVRDLELPNEDTKVLERINAALLDEGCAGFVRAHNQAFISGGDIMHNNLQMHEKFHSVRD